MAECTLLETISFSFYKTISAVAQNEENTTDLIVHSWLKCVVIRGYVPQGAGFYTRYYVYVIQWQRALVVYMS